jgi:hypothetical protein
VSNNVVHSLDEATSTDDAVLNFITMTEEEFRDLLRAVADEMRQERLARH